MTVETSYLPTEWLIEELPLLYRTRPDLLTPVLDTLLKENSELRWTIIVSAYQEQRMNLGKAAELLGVHESGGGDVRGGVTLVRAMKKSRIKTDVLVVGCRIIFSGVLKVVPI